MSEPFAFWVILHVFFMSADFLQTHHFGKNLKSLQSQCQVVLADKRQACSGSKSFEKIIR